MNGMWAVRYLGAKTRRILVGAALFSALGCGSPGNFDGADPVDHFRPSNSYAWRRNGIVVSPPTPPTDLGDVSGLVGRWYINRGDVRSELVIKQRSERLWGTLSPDGSTDRTNEVTIDYLTWDSDAKKLSFRVEENGSVLLHAVDVVDGTMFGRYSIDAGDPSGPAHWPVYTGHVMGWRSESFDAALTPRVFDIFINDGRYVRLRIDQNPADPFGFTGEFKVNATTKAPWSEGELPSEQVNVRRWDGTQLVFDVANGTARERFSGYVNGRNISGSIVEDGKGTTTKWGGTRSNVLSYGLHVKTNDQRREWQERVRRILYRMIMAGNPTPLSTTATLSERSLMQADAVPGDRDDDRANWQQRYALSDVVLDHTLPNPYGPEPLRRRMHGLLAVPTTPPPPAGYSLVVSLNGHLGSAEQQFQSGGIFWYGDAYARRGYMVLALDVSHRPPAEAGGRYGDPEDGDSPDTGNHAHPAIAAPGLVSDWSDDGERVWDAMRGIDFLLSQNSINPNQIIVTGLSMGAEITEIVSALDPRVTTAVPSGAPPDMALMLFHGNHPCWKWMHGEAIEFIDMSDYLALSAPRQVILESGKWDYVYSSMATPYAVEKENAWRARVAYGDDAEHFVHYLHNGGHQYRVGDSSDDTPTPGYIQVPQRIAPPGVNRAVDWEVDGETVSLDQTLFDLLAR